MNRTHIEEVEVLAFDDSAHGHRARGLDNLRRMLGAETIVGPSAENLARLARWKGPVILQSSDCYPALAARISLGRALRGRRTVGTVYRPPHTALDPIRRLRRSIFHHALSAWPNTQLISMSPKLGLNGVEEAGPWVFDGEWWDIEEEPARCEIPGGIQPGFVLFAGTLMARKGFGFFKDIAVAAGGDLSFVAAGEQVDVSDADLAAFKAAGGIHLPGYISDQELFDLMRGASYAWCCYRPDNNMSSGIYGRALQLGTPPLVNKQTWLGSAARLLDWGVELAYGDVDGALRQLRASEPPHWSNARLDLVAQHGLAKFRRYVLND